MKVWRHLARVATFGVGVLLLAGAGMVLYHYGRARMAQEPALDPPAQAAAEVAKAEWRRQVDAPTLRLVVTAGEVYGEGNYLFVFDVYRWFGVGRGYATVRNGRRGAGGTLPRRGDPFEDAEVQHIRSQWAEEYGPGRRLGEGDAAAESALPRSMKGYELYSWPEGDGWRFVLLTGTDRSKTCAEITAGLERADGGWVQLSASTLPALEGLLARLPRGESVFWVPAGWPGLEGQCTLALPDGAAVEEIRAHCERLGIELSLPGTP